MLSNNPIRLVGIEAALVAQVPGAGTRWQQVHLNHEVARRYFGLEPGSSRSIILERISPNGKILQRDSRQLILPESNKNARIEFNFGSNVPYPSGGERPIIVVVEEEYTVFRYRGVMPGESGHAELTRLLASGPSVGRGVKRRIVNLNEVETFWPGANLRGSA